MLISKYFFIFEFSIEVDVSNETTFCVSESCISTRVPPRSRDEKKVTESGKQKITIPDESMDSSKSSPSEDVYDFKAVKEVEPLSVGAKPMDTSTTSGESEPAMAAASSAEDSKRSYSEMADSVEESANDDESRKKKRKEETKDGGKTAAPQRATAPAKGQASKQASATQNKASASAATKTAATERKSPCSSPKPAPTSDTEVEDGKTDLKVPPLKIVIPQSTVAEQETGANRNGKSSSQRPHAALPYVVPSSNNESSDKEAVAGTSSPTATENSKSEDKKEVSPANTDEQVCVLRLFQIEDDLFKALDSFLLK